MKKDIQSSEDIVLLVNTFYDSVKINPTLGFIFDDVAKVNWEMHLPKMYAFWGSILLEEHSYDGNPMIKHIQLGRQVSLAENEFTEWLALFWATVDHLFEGPVAEVAKVRSANIARLMLHKVKASQATVGDLLGGNSF
jgi:hemoglobin